MSLRARMLLTALGARPRATAAGAAAVAGGVALAAPREAQGEPLAPITRQEVEDLYVRVGDSPAPRVSPEQSQREGRRQGLALDWYDDMRRGGPRARSALQQLREQYRADPTNRDLAARLIAAEQAYDPVTFAAAANPDEFGGGRLTGEVAIGAGIGIPTYLASRRFGQRGQMAAGAAVGALKGGVYGAGAGTGEATTEDRITGAARDAAITGAVSGLAVPVMRLASRAVQHAPIHLQQARNALTPNYSGPRAVDMRSRLGAPRELTLRPGVSADEVVARAQAADDYRASVPAWRRGLEPSPLVPRLQAAVNLDDAGRAEQRRLGTAEIARRMPPPRRFSSVEPTVAVNLERRALLPQFDVAELRTASNQERSRLANLLRRRLRDNALTDDEYEFLATPAGRERLRQLGVFAPNAPIGEPVVRPAARSVNPSLRDRVPQRIAPEAAQELARSLSFRTPVSVPRVSPQDPVSPRRAGLTALLSSRRVTGYAPDTESLLTKGSKLAAAAIPIPIAGGVNSMMGWESTPKPQPSDFLGTDPEARRRLAEGGVQEDIGTATAGVSDAAANASRRIDDEIAALEREAASFEQEARDQLRRNPPTRWVRRGEERVQIDNRREHRAAQANAQELRGRAEQARQAAQRLEASRAQRIEAETTAARRQLEGMRGRLAALNE